MSAPIDEKLDTSDVDPTDEREPARLPPVPEMKIRGVAADVWATGVERELTEGRQRVFDAEQGIRKEIESVGRYVRDGFDLFGNKLLPSVQKIESTIDEVRRDQSEIRKEQIEQRRVMFAIVERQNEIVGSHEQIKARLDALESTKKIVAKVQRPKRARKKR